MTYPDQLKIKQDFVTNIQQFLIQQSIHYYSYFFTMTFHDPNFVVEREYQKYFEQFTRRLNNMLIRGNEYKRSAILIMFPEYESKNNKFHFHGVLNIHKTTIKNFNYKCHSGYGVESFEKTNPYTQETERDIRSYLLLSDYIVNCFTKYKSRKRVAYKIKCEPDDFENQNCTPLRVHDYRLYGLGGSQQQIDNVVRYSTKKMKSNNIQYDDIFVGKMTKPNPNDRYYAKKRKMVSGQY